MNECNCSLCVKVGATWGYFDLSEVTITGVNKEYIRIDKPEPITRLHFCGNCGVTTYASFTESYASSVDSNDWRAVNMRLFSNDAKANVELRFPDGAAWDGIGEFGYVRDAII